MGEDKHLVCKQPEICEEKLKNINEKLDGIPELKETIDAVKGSLHTFLGVWTIAEDLIKNQESNVQTLNEHIIRLWKAVTSLEGSASNFGILLSDINEAIKQVEAVLSKRVEAMERTFEEDKDKRTIDVSWMVKTLLTAVLVAIAGALGTFIVLKVTRQI